MGSLIIMGTGQDFERALVKAFNSFFELSGTKAIAYRRPQTRYQPQLFDIFVDSRATLARLKEYLKFNVSLTSSTFAVETAFLLLSLGVRRLGSVRRFLCLGDMFGTTFSGEIRISRSR